MRDFQVKPISLGKFDFVLFPEISKWLSSPHCTPLDGPPTPQDDMDSHTSQAPFSPLCSQAAEPVAFQPPVVLCLLGCQIHQTAYQALCHFGMLCHLPGLTARCSDSEMCSWFLWMYLELKFHSISYETSAISCLLIVEKSHLLRSSAHLPEMRIKDNVQTLLFYMLLKH